MSDGLPFSKLAGLLCLSLLVLEPVSAQVNAPEVSSLNFNGNRTFSDEALANGILTRETECRSFIVFPFCLAGSDFSLDPRFLNEREFKRDFDRVRLFYYLRGFRETVVDTVVDRSVDGEVRVDFQISEGEPIRVDEISFLWIEEIPDTLVPQGPPIRADTTSFLASEEVPDSLVGGGIPIRIGEPLSLTALESSRDSLIARLRNRGFAHGEVLVGYKNTPDTPYGAQVNLEIYPGPLTRFGPVTVVFEPTPGRIPTMEEDVVLRMLPFREGDVYQEDLQFAGQRNLYNLEVFRFVRFYPDTLVDSILPITIRLQEDDVHRVRTGGGLNTAECVNFEASWNNRNFMGGARRLQVTGRLSNVLASQLHTILCNDAGEDQYGNLTGSVAVDFTQPWFFSPRNSVSAGVFLERQSVPDLFVRTAVGFTLGFNRTLGLGTLLGLSYRPELTQLTAVEVFFCSAYLICAPEEIALLQGRNFLSPVSVALSRDRRNQPLSPTRGYSLAADFEYAADWTGSDFLYTRVVTDGTLYVQPRSNWVLATRLKGGWVGPGGFQGFVGSQSSGAIVHPEKRLYGGGSNSVRGFAQNRLGPTVLYLQNVEKLYDGEGPDGQGPPCTGAEVLDLTCDAGDLKDGAFFPSPTGGTKLLEGSVELRFPISGRLWEGASFVDFGQVWGEDTSPRFADLEITPGLGVRFFSPIGPIRVDVGYRFGSGKELPVVTQRIELDASSATGFAKQEDLVVLKNRIPYGYGLGAWDPRRFQLHLSIGQAF